MPVEELYKLFSANLTDVYWFVVFTIKVTIIFKKNILQKLVTDFERMSLLTSSSFVSTRKLLCV